MKTNQLETCQRKKKYLDAESARAKAAISAKHTGDEYQVYQCPVCRFWHITTIGDVYWKVQAQRQAREIAADDLRAARAEVDELLAHAAKQRVAIVEDQRRAAEQEQEEREKAERLKDLQHTLAIAAGFSRLIDAQIHAQIRARRKKRKLKKKLQRKQR